MIHIWFLFSCQSDKISKTNVTWAHANSVCQTQLNVTHHSLVSSLNVHGHGLPVLHSYCRGHFFQGNLRREVTKQGIRLQESWN